MTLLDRKKLLFNNKLYMYIPNGEETEIPIIILTIRVRLRIWEATFLNNIGKPRLEENLLINTHKLNAYKENQFPVYLKYSIFFNFDRSTMCIKWNEET